MNIHQTIRKKTKCPECIETFFASSNLRQHVKQYHPDFPLSSIEDETLEWKEMKTEFCTDLPSCKICKRSFKKNYNLKQHMKAFHNAHWESLICKNCGKSFVTQVCMLRHQKNNCEKSKTNDDDQNTIAAEVRWLFRIKWI